MKINWDEKPEWADAWIESLNGITPSDWYADKGDFWGNPVAKRVWSKPEEGFYIVHYPPETKPEWNGEGLPPVGTVCTLVENTDFFSAHSGEVSTFNRGTKVIAVGHAKRYDNDNVCITLQPIDSFTKGFATINPEFVRPIKSDREKWAKQLCEVLGIAQDESEWIDAIYDALISGELPVPKQEK